MDILQFPPRADRERSHQGLAEAFDTVVDQAVGVFSAKGEAGLVELAKHFMTLCFEMCFHCQSEAPTAESNIARIERCSNEDCPLHPTFPKVAAAMMEIATGDKKDAGT